MRLIQSKVLAALVPEACLNICFYHLFYSSKIPTSPSAKAVTKCCRSGGRNPHRIHLIFILMSASSKWENILIYIFNVSYMPQSSVFCEVFFHLVFYG